MFADRLQNSAAKGLRELHPHIYIEAADFSDLGARRLIEGVNQLVERLARLGTFRVLAIADCHFEGVAPRVDL